MPIILACTTDLLIRVHGSEAATVTGLSSLGSNALNLFFGSFLVSCEKEKLSSGAVPISKISRVVIICHDEI